MMKLGILFGGSSYEHEISIITAFQLKKRLEEKYEIHLIYATLEGDFYNADYLSMEDFKLEHFKKLKKLNLSKLKLDCVVGAMHGENGEDGLAYDFCRINHLKYLGCEGFASSVSMDKYRCYQYLKDEVPMLKTIYYTYEDYLNEKKIDVLPCIMKPIYGGSSIGIVVAYNEEELEEKLSEAFKYSKEIVIQPYIPDLEEYNLALNEETCSNLERINHKDAIFSFDNKYSDSFKLMHQNLLNSELYEEFCAVARRVYHLIHASGIIRIDFFLIGNEIYVNEVNTTPGALSMYLFPDFDKVFDESLRLCLKRSVKNYPKFHFLLKNNINK